jgi:hypothetical protein
MLCLAKVCALPYQGCAPVCLVYFLLLWRVRERAGILARVSTMTGEVLYLGLRRGLEGACF